MTDDIGTASTRAKLPALDQKLVREVARALWRISVLEKKLDTDARKADWEQSRSHYVSQARKLIRHLNKDGIIVQFSA